MGVRMSAGTGASELDSSQAEQTTKPAESTPPEPVRSPYEMRDPNALVLAHQGLVISVANSIYRRTPRHIPLEDLISYGQVGLLQAARSYLPQPNTEFGTYAFYRISGAIYEGLTSMNWTSRAEYQRRKAEESANEVLQQEANTKSQTVDGNRVGPEQAAWLGGTIQRLSAVFLLSQMPEGEGNNDDPTDPGQDPCQAVVGTELRDIVNQAVDGLPDEAKELIRLVYYQEHSLAQAAKMMGKSRSWASRFHSMVLEKLAIRLSGVDA